MIPRTVSFSKFIFYWIMVTCLGWVVGWAIALFLLDRYRVAALSPVPIIISIIILGLQWLFIIRKHIPNTEWWLPVSILGIVLAVVVVEKLIFPIPLFHHMVGYSQSFLTIGITGGTVIGSFVGVSQWLVLRRIAGINKPRSIQWVFANLLAWAIGLPANLVSAAEYFYVDIFFSPMYHYYDGIKYLNYGYALSMFLTRLCVFMIPAALTGIVFWRLTRTTLTHRRGEARLARL